LPRTWLLRLYPRAWRERYGQEFLALLGEGPLSPAEWLDVMRGAMDAWLSGESGAAAAPAPVAANGGRTMRLKALMACERRTAPVTVADGLLGAGVMVGLSLLLLLARRIGWPDGGKALAGLSFPMALVVSMPFWLMKGTPRRVQAAIIGGTLTILALIGVLSSLD